MVCCAPLPRIRRLHQIRSEGGSVADIATSCRNNWEKASNLLAAQSQRGSSPKIRSASRSTMPDLGSPSFSVPSGLARCRYLESTAYTTKQWFFAESVSTSETPLCRVGERHGRAGARYCSESA
jgi:hypothetical protein